MTATIQGGSSGTQGWDAVCAIDVNALNNLLFDWYVVDHPSTPVATLRTGFASQSRSFLLDLSLGPPRLRFSEELSVSRQVVSGRLIEYDSNAQIITSIDTTGTSLSGSVSFTAIAPSVAQGVVALDLTDGAWELTGLGIDPEVHQALNSAVSAYYLAVTPVITLCELRSSPVDPALQPTSFALATQADPANPSRGCLLIMIATNGVTNNQQPGTATALQDYPIPNDSTAALIVSNAVLFKSLLPNQLTNATRKTVTFKGHQMPTGSWATKVDAGTKDFGVLEGTHGNFFAWGTFWTTSGGADYPESSVIIPLSDLTLQADGKTLTASYHHSWTQTWAVNAVYTEGSSTEKYEVPTSLDYDSSATLNVDPVTCVVTFKWTGALACRMDAGHTGLGDDLFSDQVKKIKLQLSDSLADVFRQLTLAEVDTFALQNLFFPNQVLSLSAGSVPGDLHLTGTLEPTITLAPNLVSVTAGGGPAKITASGSGQDQLVWQLRPRSIGMLHIDGLTATYTPPASLERPMIITLTVTNGPDSGGAVILLSPAQPSEPTATGSVPLYIEAEAPSYEGPGATWTLTATDEDGGTPEGLRWVAVPVAVGTLEDNGSGATYTSPATRDPGTASEVRIFAYEPSASGSPLFGFVDLPLQYVTLGAIGNHATDRPHSDTWRNFTVVDTNRPAPFDGQFTSINYFAKRSDTIRFVIVDTHDIVRWISDEIAPTGSGAETVTFNEPVEIRAGWNLGVYSKNTGVISFDDSGTAEPAVFDHSDAGLPKVGETLTRAGVSARCYSMNATVFRWG